MGGDAQNILGALLGNPQMETVDGTRQRDTTPNPLLSIGGMPAGLIRNLLSGPGYNDLPIPQQLANAIVMAGGAAATEGKAAPGIYGAFSEAATQRDTAKVTAAEKAAGAKKLEDLFTEAATPEWQEKYILERTLDSSGKEGATVKNKPPSFTADAILGNAAMAEAWKRGMIDLTPSGEVTADGRPRYKLTENKAKTAEARAFGSARGTAAAKFAPLELPGELPATPGGMDAPAGLSPAQRESALKAEEANAASARTITEQHMKTVGDALTKAKTDQDVLEAYLGGWEKLATKEAFALQAPAKGIAEGLFKSARQAWWQHGPETEMSTDRRQLVDNIERELSEIQRRYGGEKGVISDKDIARARKGLTDPTISRQTFLKNLAHERGTFAAKIERMEERAAKPMSSHRQEAPSRARALTDAERARMLEAIGP